MRSYSVPPNINEKEKVVGGLLNINQLFWVIGGLGIGAVMFLLTYSFLGKASLFVGGVFAMTGLPFALVKIKELTLFEYLKRKKEFKKKTKYLIHKRKQEEI